MERFLYVVYIFREMEPSIIRTGEVEIKLSLPSVLIQGMSRQSRFSVDVGITRPEGQYVYRATREDASIRPPYRQIRIGDQPTSVITPRHLDGMLAEIVRIYFKDDLRPLRLASDLNPAAYNRLYQHLVKPALPPDTSWAGN